MSLLSNSNFARFVAAIWVRDDWPQLAFKVVGQTPNPHPSPDRNIQSISLIYGRTEFDFCSTEKWLQSGDASSGSRQTVGISLPAYR